ncbi:MAG TPA: methyltransferase [Vicinamibacterales bacterium]|nr:methyltransferase [Vicinamibacterales bacterium]
MSWLLARALLAFLALPFVMGFVMPLFVIEPHWRERPFELLALAPLVTGALMLLACVREFYVRGKGTLAPWSPPVHLVTSGPYRRSRNPMYVAMSILILGWALAFHSTAILWYALVMVGAFHARILLGEEPRLARVFGEAWTAYRARVPRWFGRI